MTGNAPENYRPILRLQDASTIDRSDKKRERSSGMPPSLNDACKRSRGVDANCGFLGPLQSLSSLENAPTCCALTPCKSKSRRPKPKTAELKIQLPPPGIATHNLVFTSLGNCVYWLYLELDVEVEFWLSHTAHQDQPTLDMQAHNRGRLAGIRGDTRERKKVN